MTTSPPTLYWYQLTSGTLASAYWGQLDTCVRSLCTENSISLPTAPWYSTIAGTLNSAWIIQIDAKVRALCTALSVTAMVGSPVNLIAGTETANYYAALDATVRALCAASGGYHASAVHFDGSAHLSIASFAAGPDTAVFSSSKWIKTSTFNGAGFWVVDPVDTYTSAEQLGSIPNNCLIPTFADAAFSKTLSVNLGAAVGLFPSNQWVNALVSCDTSLSAGNKILQIYLNDVVYTFSSVDAAAAFLMTFTGLPFFIGSDTFGSYTGDFADIWIAPGQFIDFSVEANRRKFISAAGKPIDLGADGSTPTGTAPAVFFTGNAAAFPTNQGTGGAFTLTGSLTNASTSPSD